MQDAAIIAHDTINMNGISIDSAAFAGLTVVTNTQTNTDRLTTINVDIYRSHIYVLSACDVD